LRTCRKGSPHSLLVWMLTGTATMENSMEVPQKIKNRINIWSSNTPGYLSKENKNTNLKRYMHTCVYCKYTCIFKAKVWKQPKYPLIGEWVKNSYIYVMEYYSAIKRNEILPFSTTWISLRGIMLSDISQTEKDKYCMISLICGI